MTDKTSPTWRLSTQLVRGALERSNYKETSEALYLTSGFVYDTAEEADARFQGISPGYLYGRYANPTQTNLEKRLALIEGAEACFVTASGMAAITMSLMGLLKAGDHVVAARALFGSCRWVCENWLRRYGVKVTFVDGADLQAWADACANGVNAALIETPANPTLAGVDIQGVADIVHSHGGLLIVDNAFASPVLQKPLQHGADVVVYSTTKHLDGQGRVLGGAILGAAKLLDDSYRQPLRHTGPALSAFNCWVVLKGMETLDLRVRAMSANAALVADALAKSGKVKQVFYPSRPDHPQFAIHQKQMLSGGSLIAFELDGGRAEAFRFLNGLRLVDISNNLGDTKSLATHPSTTTHRTLSPEDQALVGVTEGLVRVSIGIEDAADLIADVEGALAAI